MNNKYKLHGAFSWCELLTTDVAEAKRFYSTLFGWTLEPAPMSGMEYTLVKYGGDCRGARRGAERRRNELGPDRRSLRRAAAHRSVARSRAHPRQAWR